MNIQPVTRAQKLGVLQLLVAVSESIREAGPLGIPSSSIYAVLMAKGFTLADHEALIGTLKRTGLVRESGHLLTWAGPDIKA